MFQFERALNRRHELSNANLSGKGQLVQALRWFVHRAGLVMAINSHFKVLNTELDKASSRLQLSANTAFVLHQVYFEALIVNLRAMLEPAVDSLGVGSVASLLAQPTVRAGLHVYLDDRPQPWVMPDIVSRDKYLDYVQRYTEILADQQFPISVNAHPLVEKVSLIRRLANKRVAHATLDDYKLYGSDLQDVVLAVLAVAAAVDAVVGDAGTQDPLQFEHVALEGIDGLLGIKSDTAPHTANAIRGFLPMWIESGQEFPLIEAIPPPPVRIRFELGPSQRTSPGESDGESEDR